MNPNVKTKFRDEVNEKTIEKSFVTEAPRRLSVAKEVDVLVAGGGPAGIAAALAAAKAGAKVLIVERHGMLGGVWTAGLLNPLFDHDRKGFIVSELIERLKKHKAWIPWVMSHCFDVEKMKFVLETWCAELGIEFWYHAQIVDAIVEKGVVRGAVVESKSGREAVIAKVSIDSSGDGDLAARAGAEWEWGREVDGLAQPMTMMFEIDGLPETFLQKNSEWLYDKMVEAIKTHRLPYTLPVERVNYAPWIVNVPRRGAADVQLTHAYRHKGIDTRELSRATADTRRQANEAVEILRHIPEFENVSLSQTAPAMGIREGRRIVGDYRLEMEDLENGSGHDDAVTFCDFGVDIHEPAPGAGIPSGHHRKMKHYEIPLRCLLPAGLEGILTAGRCISGSHEAHASYRVTGTCMGMGQAAGLAAAWAAKDGIFPRKIDGKKIRSGLLERGVGF
ncbi:MAG: FAD-dependent oxidoreductase [Spirochaetia bacterium]|nr:FAD-dependent oxidoreductase [Spirochaetia bacterium]